MAPPFHLDRRPGLLSLCSGTGMLDLGVKLAFERVFGIVPRVLGFAEREAFAASLLMARMEEQSLEPAPVFCGDFRDLDARPLRGHCDLLAAGLPCQPYSTAGQQRGLKDARSWGTGDGPLPHALRIIEESQPALVCFENVPQWVTGGAFRKFGEALCPMGYEIQDPFFVRARDVGAKHQRERVFILAYLPGERSQQFLAARQGLAGQRAADAERQGQGMADASLQHWAQHGSALPEPRRSGERMADADSERAGKPYDEDDARRSQREPWETPKCRGRTMADADVAGLGQQWRPRVCDAAPLCEELADAGGAGLPHSEQCRECGECGECGEQRQPHHGQSTAELRGSLLADADREGLPRWGQFGGEFGKAHGPTLGNPIAEFCRSLFAPGPDDAAWSHIVKLWPHLSPPIEPGVRVLVDGVAVALDSARADQLRAGGNGVVALQAAAAFTHLFRQLR